MKQLKITLLKIKTRGKKFERSARGDWHTFTTNESWEKKCINNKCFQINIRRCAMYDNKECLFMAHSSTLFINILYCHAYSSSTLKNFCCACVNVIEWILFVSSIFFPFTNCLLDWRWISEHQNSTIITRIVFVNWQNLIFFSTHTADEAIHQWCGTDCYIFNSLIILSNFSFKFIIGRYSFAFVHWAHFQVCLTSNWRNNIQSICVNIIGIFRTRHEF